VASAAVHAINGPRRPKKTKSSGADSIVPSPSENGAAHSLRRLLSMEMLLSSQTILNYSDKLRQKTLTGEMDRPSLIAGNPMLSRGVLR
jgi:hypothetical protein